MDVILSALSDLLTPEGGRGVAHPSRREVVEAQDQVLVWITRTLPRHGLPYPTREVLCHDLTGEGPGVPSRPGVSTEGEA